ncbi:MAG: hypothetical protein FWE82_09130, partial [Defluviitaleaceae bacterium]|nr:hypothetical protein [Defluviitaleaceae bacterium]
MAEINSDWYLHKGFTQVECSPLSAARYIGRPAGMHGWMQARDGGLVFEDGSPFKFWASNVTTNGVWDPDKKVLNAKRLAGLGINSMRFHKFTYQDGGVCSKGTASTVLDPHKMDCMDKYFCELKDEGIYVTWSHIWGHRANELDNLPSGFTGSSYGLANFAKDLQALLFTITKNLLNHFNPYTGLRYADDPALAAIELQNEDNMFWSMQSIADKYPYYRNMLNKMFSVW